MTIGMEPQEIFARHGIAAGELRWAGRPRSGLLFRRTDAYFIPLTVFGFLFAVFWESMAIKSRDPTGMTFGAVFIAVASYYLFGRLVWDAYQRSKTYYAVTSDSAVIARQGSSTVQRIYLPAIQALGLTLSPDGSGTISFGDPSQSLMWYPFAAPWLGGPLVPAFEGVADARHVYAVCVSAQHGAAT